MILIAILVLLSPVVLRRPPSCPNHDYPVRTEGDSFDIVPLAGEITQIPEFHDCQRLLVLTPRKELGYGPLVGIWSALSLKDRLESLALANAPSPTVGAAPVGGADSGEATATSHRVTALAFAEIFAWDGGYEPLGIGKTWNCLYLFPDPDTVHLAARMVRVQKKEACLEPQPVEALVGDTVTRLFLTRDPSGGKTGGDFPPVSRWDWDRKAQVQYIGIKCGGAWCEIRGSKEYQPSPRYGSTGAVESGRPVLAVKGWYDEQMLADKKSGWFFDWVWWASRARPSGFFGTIIPDPLLDSRRPDEFKRWVPAGQVVITASSPKYEAFGYGPGKMIEGGGPEHPASVSLCMGDGCGNVPSCGSAPSATQWWAKVEYGGTTTYRCVTQVNHGSPTVPTIPGAARWFWEAEDEKGWYECAAGCCTVR